MFFFASRASQLHHSQNNVCSNLSTALLSANGSIISTLRTECICLNYLHLHLPCCVSLTAKGTVGIATPLWTVCAPLQGRVFVVIPAKEKNFVVIIHSSRPTDAPFDPVQAPAQAVHVAFECRVTLMSNPSIAHALRRVLKY